MKGCCSEHSEILSVLLIASIRLDQRGSLRASIAEQPVTRDQGVSLVPSWARGRSVHLHPGRGPASQEQVLIRQDEVSPQAPGHMMNKKVQLTLPAMCSRSPSHSSTSLGS